MKRIAIGIVAALLVLAAVIVTRTLQVAAPADAAIASDSSPPPGADSMLVAQHLSQAIKFQTVSYDGATKEKERNAATAEFRDWMARTYPYLFESAPQELVGDSLLFTWQGTNPNLAPVLLMAHMDVVPVVPGTEKDWTHEPFSGDIADGFVWGRGAIDDKSSLIAILEAGERLAASRYQPSRTIMFAFGQDEESGGGLGNATIAKALAQRGVHFTWVLDEGSPIMREPYPGVRQTVALIGVAEKGFLTLDLVAHGTGGHSAMPTRDLALPRLATAINNLVASPFASDFDAIQRAKLDVLTPLAPFVERMKLANLWLTKPFVLREMEDRPASAAMLHTTISPTMLDAGVKDNVIPPTARAVVNFRLHQRDTIDAVVAHVKSAINDPKVDVTEHRESRSEASGAVGADHPAYQYLTQKIKDAFAIPVAPELICCATDSRHYAAMTDAVLHFNPFAMEPADIPRIHGTNERIAVESLGPAVGFYLRVMRDLK